MDKIITFGKYKGQGKTFAEVLETDRSWLQWIRANTTIPLPYDVIQELKKGNTVTLDPDVPLTDQQRQAAQALIDGESVVVIGPAGTGKTQILRAIKGNTTARIAPTGIAALNISGVTFHSIFKIDPNDPLMKICKPLDRSITVAMFDECFYSSASLLFRAIESIQKTAPDTRFLFMGDPMQLKPVHARIDEKEMLELDDDEREIVGDLDAWKGSTLFDVLDHFGITYRKFVLTRSIRHENIDTFNIMMGARTGSLTPEQLAVLNARVTDTPPDDAFALVPTNLIRKKLNALYLQRFKDSIQLFKPEQYVRINESGSTNEERLETFISKNPKMDFLRGKLKRSGFKFRAEEFAVGCKIMITKNDSKMKIVNGDMGHITKITNDAIHCHIDRLNCTLPIKRIFNGFETRDKVVKIGLMVYPLRVAAAATIHKTQGITVFGPLHIHVTPEMRKQTGLLYTAITRVRELEQLTFSAPVTNRHFAYDKTWAALLGDLAKV